MAVVWLIVGFLLVAAEVVSGEFVLLMLGASALVAAGSAALGAPLWLDVALFAMTSLALVTLARPVLKRRLQLGTGTRTGIDALVGMNRCSSAGCSWAPAPGPALMRWSA